MTGPFEVLWSPDARADWRRMPLAEARAVATAVERWAQTGQGIVTAGEAGAFLLFGGAHVDAERRVGRERDRVMQPGVRTVPRVTFRRDG